VRLPLTAIFGERELSIPLDQIEKCRAAGFPLFSGFALLIEGPGFTHVFRLFRWWNPLLLWWSLTRRWVARIDEAKLRLKNEAELLMDKDAPT
jgi:hypothetical protein